MYIICYVSDPENISNSKILKLSFAIIFLDLQTSPNP